MFDVYEYSFVSVHSKLKEEGEGQWCMWNRIYEVLDKKVVNGIYYVHFAGIRFRIGAHARLTDLHFSLASLFGIYSWSKCRVTVNKRKKGNHFFRKC